MTYDRRRPNPRAMTDERWGRYRALALKGSVVIVVIARHRDAGAGLAAGRPPTMSHRHENEQLSKWIRTMPSRNRGSKEMVAVKRGPRIVLFGLFGVGNYGNEASLEAMLRQIRELLPGAEVSCVCGVPEKVSAEFGLPAVQMGSVNPAWLLAPGLFARVCRRLLRLPLAVRRWGVAVRYLKGMDQLIIPGTGILDDFGEPPSGLPYTLLTWCAAARVRGTKISFVSVGAGPIHHPLSRRLMKSAARLAHYRSYRDSISKEFMASIGFDTAGDKVYPDLVFGLPRPIQQHRPEGNGLSVGIGVMAYYGWANREGSANDIYATYIKKITQFVVWLLEQGHHVRLLVGEATDQRAVSELLAQVALIPRPLHRGSIVAEPIASLHELMREIAATDIVVATRFHNVVCALMLNKPVISCGYARKNDVLLDDMGLGEYCQSVESLDVARLRVQFEGIVRNREHIRLRLQDKNIEYQQRLARQYAYALSATTDGGSE